MGEVVGGDGLKECDGHPPPRGALRVTLGDDLYVHVCVEYKDIHCVLIAFWPCFASVGCRFERVISRSDCILNAFRVPRSILFALNAIYSPNP